MFENFFKKFPSLKEDIYVKDKSGFYKDWFELHKAFTLQQVKKCCINKQKLKNDKKVYAVGDHGPEHNSVHSIHKTYKGAKKAWNILRLELLEEVKPYLKNGPNGEMWQRIVKSLSCEDPKKIDNYPHETPYIIEYTIEE